MGVSDISKGNIVQCRITLANFITEYLIVLILTLLNRTRYFR